MSKSKISHLILDTLKKNILNYLLATLTSTERLVGLVGLFALNKISINRCSHSKVAGSAKSNSIPMPPASSSGENDSLTCVWHSVPKLNSSWKSYALDNFEAWKLHIFQSK